MSIKDFREELIKINYAQLQQSLDEYKKICNNLAKDGKFFYIHEFIDIIKNSNKKDYSYPHLLLPVLSELFYEYLQASQKYEYKKINEINEVQLEYLACVLNTIFPDWPKPNGGELDINIIIELKNLNLIDINNLFYKLLLETNFGPRYKVAYKFLNIITFNNDTYDQLSNILNKSKEYFNNRYEGHSRKQIFFDCIVRSINEKIFPTRKQINEFYEFIQFDDYALSVINPIELFEIYLDKKINVIPFLQKHEFVMKYNPEYTKKVSYNIYENINLHNAKQIKEYKSKYNLIFDDKCMEIFCNYGTNQSRYNLLQIFKKKHDVFEFLINEGCEPSVSNVCSLIKKLSKHQYINKYLDLINGD